MENFENSLRDLQKSLKWISTKSNSYDKWIGIDAVSKRFEVSFEYLWRMLKISSEYQGTEAPGPRPAIQAAMQYGWITKPENFFEYLEARNKAVHDYFQISSEKYLDIAQRFLVDSKEVLKKIKKL